MSTPATHCPGCGDALATGTCDGPRGCLPELDPFRYCPACGGWLSVRVSTGGWISRCRACGAEHRSGSDRPLSG